MVQEQHAPQSFPNGTQDKVDIDFALLLTPCPGFMIL